MRRHLAFLTCALSLCAFACGGPSMTGDASDSRNDSTSDASIDAPLDIVADIASDDDAGAQCVSDAVCSDGVFCNGVERCLPADPAADARGCVPAATTSPCTSTQTCDEARDMCLTACDVEPDADHDMHRAVACGGDDCDDADPMRHPGAMEICDTMDRDEDCDPSTFGFRDSDGDGYPDARCCNADTSGMRNCGEDCNDSRPNIHPALAEVCDGVDNDCNGMTDEGVGRTFYPDGDGDGYGDSGGSTMTGCIPPSGYSETRGDCDDTNGTVHPGAPEVCDAAMLDENCDGEANPAALCMCAGDISRPCALPGACSAGTQRCVGGSWGACSIMPVSETCNRVDDDCNGTIDDGVSIACYPDADNDGYPTAGGVATQVCPVPGREFVGGCPPNLTNRLPQGTATDCNDMDPSTNPGSLELCDAAMVDEDCDGIANPPTRCVCSGTETRVCPLPGACSAGTQTCSGGAWAPCSISPIVESCNAVDDNCDGMVDEGLTVTCYADDDNDTYATSGAGAMSVCPVAGRTFVGGCPTNQTNRAPTTGSIDCNATDATINPGAIELCDAAMVDENCDGMVNNGCSCTTGSSRSCTQPGACASGTQTCSGGAWGPCSVSPVSESCNAIDDDCDGMVDEGLTVLCFVDADNDTFAPAGSSAVSQCPTPGRESVGGCASGFTNVAPMTGTTDCDDTSAARNPGVGEVCNGVDDNCNGTIDETLRVTCYADSDGDTYPPSGAMSSQQCPAAGRSSVGGCPIGLTNRAPTMGNVDCADGNAAVNPAATEVCNSVDDNCNGSVDEGLRVTCYADGDGDTYAPMTSPNTFCPVAGRTAVGGCPSNQTNRAPTSASTTDCNDMNALINPAASEICDAAMVDENCNGVRNEASVCSCTGGSSRACMLPGACAAGTQTCTGGSWSACSIMPTAETCDNVDNNCDGNVDEGLRVTCFPDSDDDGYPAAGAMALAPVCPVASRTSVGGCPLNTTNRSPVTGSIDCNDSNSSVHPGVTDLCNGVDDNCDGTVDDPSTADTVCAAPSAYGACRRGSCVLIACYPNTADCDGVASNGCEVDLTQPSNCGQCAVTCGVGGTCTSGHCSTISDVDTSGGFSCAVRQGGTVVCWGRGTSGELGNGTMVSSSVPVVVSLMSPAVEVETGASFACARTSDSHVWCWGSNASGQLGNGSAIGTTSTIPVAVSGITTATSLSVGGSHACVAINGGAVWCWGANGSGQLGDSTRTNRNVPVHSSGTSTALSVACGSAHTCMRRDDNTARCWGSNSAGQLGDGTTTDSTVPVTVPGLDNVVQMAAGRAHTCSRHSGGAIRCWGTNTLGQLGDGTNTRRTSPVVSGAFTNASYLTVGQDFSCAIENGDAFCWGEGASGQIGNNSLNDRVNPQTVHTFHDFVQVASSSPADTVCARRQTGQVVCWGSNTTSAVGDQTTTNRDTPTSVLNIFPNVVLQIMGGNAHTCALLATGRVTCWGENANGQLGNGSTTDSLSPVLANTITTAVEIATGANHTCARTLAGQVYCWGQNTYGQLGNGTTTSQTAPVLVTGLTGALEIEAGDNFTCARRATDVLCWGNDSNGQLGDGVPGANRTTAGPAVAGIGTAVEIAAGNSRHACARLPDGSVRCWGANAAGQIGSGMASTGLVTATRVSGVNDALELDAGGDFSCVRLSNGDVGCWGYNSTGQCGDLTLMDHAAISTVAVLRAEEIDLATTSACARMRDGTVQCWGSNSQGQLGNGMTGSPSTPVAVMNLTGPVALGRGGSHFCALRGTLGRSMDPRCWGDNASGQLGDGTRTDSNVPVIPVDVP